MANKNTKTNYGIVKATAFWGIIIAGISGVITLIITLLLKLELDFLNGVVNVMNSVANITNLIATIALFVSAFLAGYEYSKGKKNTVLIVLFWVFSILAFLAILGFNVMNMF